MRGLLYFIAGVLIGFGFGSKYLRGSQPSDLPITRIERDTIKVLHPVAVEVAPARMERYVLPLWSCKDSDTTFRDTMCNIDDDSAAVVVPIIQRHYSDSLYDVWISGFEPQLDSINVYSQREISLPKTTPLKRWGIGVSAGLGIGRNGLQPFIGASVSYNLLLF